MLKDAKKITKVSDWMSHTMENIFWEKMGLKSRTLSSTFFGKRHFIYIYIL